MAKRGGSPPSTRESAMKPDPNCPLGLPKRRLDDGSPNIEFHRERYYRTTRLVTEATLKGERSPIDIKQVNELYMAEAKLDGFSEREIVDRRTDAEIYRDEAARVLEAPDALFEVTDQTLDHLESEIERAVGKCQAVIEEANGGMTPEMVAFMNKAGKVADEVILSRGKAWLNRLRRVRRLREMVRNPVPKDIEKKATQAEKYAWEASRVLRYMLYVGRANNRMKKGSSDATANLFVFGDMHCRMAVACWEAEHGVMYDDQGISKGAKNWKGVIIIAPPGHGKSEFAMNHAALWISDKPQTQGAYLHNAEEMAEESMRYIRMAFDPKTDRGRRSIALFPAVRLAKLGNNASQMQVVVKAKTKSPTMIASGVMSDRQGSNTDYQIRDDIVPQKDIYEPTTRERRKKILHGTWDRRQRGDGTFALHIGTLWHHDDALCEMVRTAAKDGLYKVCTVRCGGPRSVPAFKPAWPEVYDSEYLRGVYTQLGDARLWAAAYMADPRSEETSIVSKVRLYDATSEDHRDFVTRAIMHVSVDPAATNREKNDKAGIVYAAVGDVRIETPSGVAFVTKMRILDAREMHNTGAELVEAIGRYCGEHKTDYVHIETKTGFSFVAEWLDDKFGIDCIRHDPGDKSKERRLRQCSGMICERVCRAGGFEPVVEFPGRPRLTKNGDPQTSNGRPILDVIPEYQWLADQFTMFGVHPDDHALDATTQLINYLSKTGALPASGGMITQKMVDYQKTSEDAKKIKGDLSQFAKKKSDESWDDIGEFWKGSEETWN